MTDAMNLNSAKAGTMSDLVSNWEIDPIELDSPDGQKHFTWSNAKNGEQMGYYRTISELGSSIDGMSKWAVGKGIKAEDAVMNIIKKIRGWGKSDSFNNIIRNGMRVYQIHGDSYAQIITTDGEFINSTGSNLGNLKTLNGKRMTHIVNAEGVLTGYEYSTGANSMPQSFDPEEIFHLCWNRIADEVHGISIIEKLVGIIAGRNEAMDDLRVVFHRYVKPLWIWKLNTDDDTKIAEFQAKADSLVQTGDNIYIPMGAAEADRVSVPQYSTLDPLPWIMSLTQYFYQATGMPDVILGSAKETTEASAKILYLAFQQSVEEHQLFLEENIEAQLHLKVNFEFPASIAADLLKDNQKDGKVNNDKKDTQTGIKGKK